jgi:2-polyprenyl-3-methyl-5-hydroxy-6-metoxy-1,4-benzoquinol methylase
MRECPNCGSEDCKTKLTEGDFNIVKCSGCGLVYLQNIPEENEIYEDYYEIKFCKDDYSMNSKYDYLAEICAINQQRLCFLKKFKKEGKLLDVGCGSGLFMKTASDKNYDVYGIDVSNKALSFARDEFKLNVQQRNLNDLIKENRKFDIITLWHVLEHFMNPIDELKKVRALLSNDGICFIEVPNFNSIKFKLSRNKWKGGNHPLYHRTFFTSKTLRETIQESGFSTSKRHRISYKLPRKSFLFNGSKKMFNLFAMDAFLDYVVWR